MGLDTGATEDLAFGGVAEGIVQAGSAKLLRGLGSERNGSRSGGVERGLAMLEAYVERWRNEPYEVIRRPDTGQPYVEIGFSIYLFDWIAPDGGRRPVFYVGRIDRIMRSKITGRAVNVESKTTSQNIDMFMKQIRPNHQVTGYHLAAKRLGLEIEETLWDAVFVSSRKPNPKAGGWMAWGIDFEKDFGRHTTRRTDQDIEDYLENDLIPIAWERCNLLYGARQPSRWPRNAPTACSQYGGCQFRDVCASNLNPDLIRSNFKIEVWEPWKGITEDRVVKA